MTADAEGPKQLNHLSALLEEGGIAARGSAAVSTDLPPGTFTRTVGLVQESGLKGSKAEGSWGRPRALLLSGPDLVALTREVLQIAALPQAKGQGEAALGNGSWTQRVPRMSKGFISAVLSELFSFLNLDIDAHNTALSQDSHLLEPFNLGPSPSPSSLFEIIKILSSLAVDHNALEPESRELQVKCGEVPRLLLIAWLGSSSQHVHLPLTPFISIRSWD